jgi:Nucleotidyltransferase of unknown function (DUF6036)
MPTGPRTELPAEPWRSFLSDLDATLDEPADLHCIGGFAISQYFGFGRETADLDVLSVAPQPMRAAIAAAAGRGSALHGTHRVFIDQVGVANFPDEYESRLRRAWPVWKKLRLWIPEPHDLALTKLERSNERDIRDVMFLAQAGLIDQDMLIARFEREMEPYLVGPTPTWHRTTLNMWIRACWPERE